MIWWWVKKKNWTLPRWCIFVDKLFIILYWFILHLQNNILFQKHQIWTGKYLFSEQGCSNYLTMLKIPHIISYTSSYFSIHTLLFFFIKIEMDFTELWCIIVYVWLRQVTVDSRKWEPHITRYRDTFFLRSDKSIIQFTFWHSNISYKSSKPRKNQKLRFWTFPPFFIMRRDMIMHRK